MTAFYFRCVVKVPPGIETGRSHHYFITASENLGAGLVTAPPAGGAVNPETGYFK